jgi:hypothetical protein
MKGKATTLSDEGVYKTISNHDVFRWLGVADSFTELRIRRLNFWKRIFRDTTRSMSVIASVFCKLDTHHRAVPTDDNPWRLQLKEDLESLSKFDSLAEICELTADNISLLFLSDEIRTLFCEADFSILRASYISVCIPPPMWSDPTAIAASAHESKQTDFVCDFVFEDGEVCERRFERSAALASHRTAHGDFNIARACVVSNQCPACDNTFTSIEGAKSHLARVVKPANHAATEEAHPLK